MKSFLTTLLMLFIYVGLQAQEVLSVSGTVKDEFGPVVGANILVKGSNEGTITDFDGNFTIKAPKNSTLVFSFIGYQTQEVKVTGTRINVTLSDD